MRKVVRNRLLIGIGSAKLSGKACCGYFHPLRLPIKPINCLLCLVGRSKGSNTGTLSAAGIKKMEAGTASARLCNA